MIVTALAALAGPQAAYVAPVAAAVALGVAVGSVLLSWRSLVTALLLLVLFMPIRQYSIAVNLPFELEPYRVFVLVLAACWLASLLIDPRVRLRSSGLEPPLVMLAVAILGSIVANATQIGNDDLSTEVAKKLTFWLTFALVFYLIVSVVRPADVEFFIGLIVIAAAVLGAVGVIEWKTGNNPFARLDEVLPFLEPSGPALDTFRAGLNRAYASAQHPISYGAAMALVLPLALVLAYRRRSVLWMACVALIVMGSLAAIARTSILMLVAGSVVLAILRPHAARRALPLLLPLAIVIQLALPGTFSTIRASFFPKEGLVSQQAEQSVGSGRIASLGPALDEASQKPLFGRGFGTRIVDPGEKQNAFILDDEWLTTLLEIGLVGALAWVWLFFRFVGRAGRASREDDSDRGWLLAGLAASTTSFAFGMVFFDAFSFIQVTVLMLILLALGSVLLRPDAR